MILEEFTGFVHGIRDNIVYFSITTKDGKETFDCEYPLEKFTEAGIRENRKFKCRTVEKNGKVDIELEKIPDKILTKEEEQKIWDEIDKILDGY